MATIKSYTDIEQSKKLAEILPLKSADMDYIPIANIDGEYSIAVNIWDNDHVIEEGWIPCWSLVALINVLPQGTRLLKSATDETYHCDCPKGNIDKWFDSPIDAAFEMICWLKKEKYI